MAKIALYLRVSTSGQTVENQRRELELWAERAGHEIVATYTSNGISGSKGRDRRPGLDRALKDAARRRYDVLAVWSVDRLGRSWRPPFTGGRHHRGGLRGQLSRAAGFPGRGW